MLFLAFFALLETTLAADPANLKPGALSAHVGRAFLVEDIFWVKYLFPTLLEVPTYMRVITKQLDAALSQLKDNFPEEVGRAAHFLLLHARANYFNDIHLLWTIMAALSWLTALNIAL